MLSILQKTNSPLVGALLTALLLFISWPVGGFAPLLLVAFVPLLLAIYQLQQQGASVLKIWLHCYVSLLVWNILCTWWIWNASPGGALAAIICNALLMSVPFVAYDFSYKKLGLKLGLLSLICYYISFEYLHLRWELTWPWLTLGNGFASYYKFIQWYEWVGHLGGSIWILGSNVLFFYLLINYSNLSRPKLYLVGILCWIVLPIIVSLLRYSSYVESGEKVKIAIVQPNIDPYNEKFSKISVANQLAKMLSLGASVIDDSTSFLLLPETALADNIWEHQVDENNEILTIKAFQKAFPHISILGGMSSGKIYEKGETRAPSARKFTDVDEYYESYNTAFFINHLKAVQLYHKSKLVPGVERMPYPGFFSFLQKFTVDLGGASGSLGSQEERTVFFNYKHQGIAPVICYESVFGEYLGDYINKGAGIIGIITNDGWWGNTPGYRQHMAYARLRAIESRRSIARCANTGTSCFINQKGDVSNATAWWQEDAISGTVQANTKYTFYTRFGDYLGLACIAGLFVLLPFSIFKRK